MRIGKPGSELMPGLFFGSKYRFPLTKLLIKRSLKLATFLSVLTAGFSPPLAATPSKDADCYTLVYDASIGPAEMAFQQFYDLLYKQAGLCVRSIGMSTKRAEQQLRSGVVDGDWSRVEGYVERSEGTLLAIPQPIFSMAAYFISLPSSGFNGATTNIENRTVGYHAGFRWIEWNLPKLKAIPWALPSEYSVFDLLERGRMEVYATGAVNAFALSKSSRGQQVPHVLSLWQEVPFFHVIHRRHENIVPLLNQALIELIQSGEAGRILTLQGINVADIE